MINNDLNTNKVSGVRENESRLPSFIYDGMSDSPLFKSSFLKDGTIEKLLERGYKKVVDEFSDDITQYPEEKVINVLSHLTTICLKKEEPIRKQLEQLCLKIVRESLNVPTEGIEIGCELTEEIPSSQSFNINPESRMADSEYEDVASIENDENEIEKRKILYAYIIGMSDSVSDLLRKKYLSEIFELDEQLPHLYNKIMRINNYLIYTKDTKIVDGSHKQGGYVKTTLGTNDQPTTIESKAIIFPILLYETLKGCFELFISHGLPDDVDNAKRILGQTDVLKYDPWYMRIGAALCDFEIEPKYIPTFLTNLSEIPTDEFFSDMGEIIVGTKKGKKIIEDIISQAQYSDDYSEFERGLADKQEKSMIEDAYFSPEELDEANYPQSFNMEQFKEMKTFNERIGYCQQHLKRISSGSSRIAYMIDDNTVLKLAKNRKGLAQNYEEGANSSYLQNIGLAAPVYDVDDNFRWIEMAYAKQATQKDFLRITGFRFEFIASFIAYVSTKYSRNRENKYFEKEMIPYFEAIWNNADEEVIVTENGKKLYSPSKIFSQLIKYLTDYELESWGDLTRISSWGVIHTEDGDKIVLIDYGLTEDIWNKYYKR